MPSCRRACLIGLVLAIVGRSITFLLRVVPTTTIREANSSNTIQVKQQHTPKASVCMKGGKFYGRSFNRLLTLAHMLDYASQHDLDITLRPAHYQWYQDEWLDFDAVVAVTDDIPRILPQTQESTSCQFTLNAQQWFFGNLVNISYVGVQPALHLLLPFFKKSHLDQAAARLQYIRQERAVQLWGKNAAADYSSIHTVTVHARGLEGKCHKRLQTDSQVMCPAPLPADRQAWLSTCEYTYEHVQSQLSPELLDKYVVILCADPQLMATMAASWSTLAVVDNTSFPVQVSMMMLSDVHFGNPGSSIDMVVAHWRHGRPVYPWDCYKQIVEYEQRIEANHPTTSGMASRKQSSWWRYLWGQ